MLRDACIVAAHTHAQMHHMHTCVVHNKFAVGPHRGCCRSVTFWWRSCASCNSMIFSTLLACLLLQLEALEAKLCQLLGRSLHVDSDTAKFYLGEAGGDIKAAMEAFGERHCMS